jgi:GDP-mannose 6-dehydrogenase
VSLADPHVKRSALERAASARGSAASSAEVVVVGLGYVGAVTAACLAERGHSVTGVDVDPLKVDEMDRGRSPVVEPHLPQLIAAGRASGRLAVTTGIADAARGCDVIVVCVGTPDRSDGTVDFTQIERVSVEIGYALADAERFTVVVFRSTVPPGTVDGRLRPLLEEFSGRRASVDFGVAMAPEFLREGSSVQDFFEPALTVVGVSDERTFSVVEHLFGGTEHPAHPLSVEAAEALKYACNTYHALKVSFANEIGRLLKARGVDSREVMRVFCLEDRLNISPAYLRPGFAFGGSCLPKDLAALVHVAREDNVEIPVIASITRSNETHLRLAARRVLDSDVREATLLGLSFKAETDDLRHSPFVELAETLLGKGIRLRIFDPIVNPERLIGANRRYVESRLPHLGEILASTPAEALRASRFAIVGTADPAAVEAILKARPEHVLDLHGGLGHEVEALPGYEGLAW